MRDGTVRDRCLAVLKDYYGEDQDVIAAAENGQGEIFADDGKLWDQGKLDSLDRTEYVMSLEDEFGIDIDDEVYVKWRTFNDVVTHVESKSGPAHGAH